jgi:hypothetical protein
MDVANNLKKKDHNILNIHPREHSDDTHIIIRPWLAQVRTFKYHISFHWTTTAPLQTTINIESDPEKFPLDDDTTTKNDRKY